MVSNVAFLNGGMCACASEEDTDGHREAQLGCEERKEEEWEGAVLSTTTTSSHRDSRVYVALLKCWPLCTGFTRLFLHHPRLPLGGARAAPRGDRWGLSDSHPGESAWR